MKPRTRKYLKGEPVINATELSIIILSNEYVFMWGKPLHPEWVRFLQFNTIIGMINKGYICRAVINPEYKAPKLNGGNKQ